MKLVETHNKTTYKLLTETLTDTRKMPTVPRNKLRLRLTKDHPLQEEEPGEEEDGTKEPLQPPSHGKGEDLQDGCRLQHDHMGTGPQGTFLRCFRVHRLWTQRRPIQGVRTRTNHRTSLRSSPKGIEKNGEWHPDHYWPYDDDSEMFGVGQVPLFTPIPLCMKAKSLGESAKDQITHIQISPEATTPTILIERRKLY